MKRLFIGLMASLFLFSVVLADEGMFMLNKLPMKEMKKMGLQLSEKDIFNPGNGGLSDAVIIVDNGGTGAFVSPKGLLLTNHHVAFGALQKVSTPEHNYLRDGFYAPTMEQEIPSPRSEIQVLLGFKDVTKNVLKGTKDNMDPVKKTERVQKNILKITKRSEAKKEVDRARVVSFYSGKYYYLYEYKNIKDIRIVYAPPAAIGVYGGDIDNWMWPRHTGDFTFLRAYVAPDGSSAEYSKDNVPFKPTKYLPISKQGVKEGDFTIIMGHPGTTYRYSSSNRVKYYQKYVYGNRIQLFQDLIDIWEEAGKNNEEIKIKYASMVKGLNNALKNYQGMRDGFRKLHILDKKLEFDKELQNFVKSHKVLQKEYGQILEKQAQLYDEIGKTNLRDTYFGFMNYGARLLSNALRVYEWSLEKEKKEMDREAGFDDRSIKRWKMSLPIRYRNLDPTVDATALKFFLKKLVDLPQDIQYKAIQDIYANSENKYDAVEKFVDHLYSQTLIKNPEEFGKMLDMDNKELLATKDPMILFAQALYPDLKKSEKRGKMIQGQAMSLNPKYVEMIAIYKKYNHAKKLPKLKEMKKAVMDMYPDANFTQRLTYGTVKGYHPADAVDYKYITTLTGVLEKDTGEEPFNCPKKLKELYAAKDFGPYVDKKIDDVPVNFLHTTDITGGNSGSPVMNAKGEYIGIAFDGNYEAMTSDWRFDDNLTRTISCDARYILFIVDKFSNAKELMNELDIR